MKKLIKNHDFLVFSLAIFVAFTTSFTTLNYELAFVVTILLLTFYIYFVIKYSRSLGSSDSENGKSYPISILKKNERRSLIRQLRGLNKRLRITQKERDLARTKLKNRKNWSKS